MEELPNLLGSLFSMIATLWSRSYEITGQSVDFTITQLLNYISSIGRFLLEILLTLFHGGTIPALPSFDGLNPQLLFFSMSITSILVYVSIYFVFIFVKIVFTTINQALNTTNLSTNRKRRKRR